MRRSICGFGNRPRRCSSGFRRDDAIGRAAAALRALVREPVRASEPVDFALTEFEAPLNPKHRARAVQAVIRMIEPVFLAGQTAASGFKNVENLTKHRPAALAMTQSQGQH